MCKEDKQLFRMKFKKPNIWLVIFFKVKLTLIEVSTSKNNKQ